MKPLVLSKKNQSKQYLKDVEVAEIIGRSVGTLRNDRFQGRGVPYTRIGRSIFYDLDKVIEYMDSRTVQHND